MNGIKRVWCVCVCVNERTQRYNLGVVVVNGALLTSPGEVNKVWSSTMRYMESIVHSEDFAACNIYSWAELSSERERRGRWGEAIQLPQHSSFFLPSLLGWMYSSNTHSRRRAHERPVPYWPLLNPVLYTQHTVEYLSVHGRLVQIKKGFLTRTCDK